MPSIFEEASIPAVLVGVTRQTALGAIGLFDGTPYYIAAVLDMRESPESYQFSPQNLGVVLNALHPRPRILVTGTALEAGIVANIEPVWESHIGRLAERSCWVALSKTHGQPGPPPPGTEKELMKQLDAVFRPQIRHD